MVQPTLRQLTTFLSTVDSGSVTRAARSLNLTQSAASQQLRELERILGVRLLDRAKGKVIPSAAGEALLPAARRARIAIDDLMEAAVQLRSGDIAHLRLGTGSTACIYLLPQTFASVKRRMPRLQVAVTTGNTSQILDQLEEGIIDVALVTLPIRPSRALVATPVIVDPLLALLPEDRAPTNSTIEPVQLTHLPLILYETGGNTRTIINTWFHRAGIDLTPAMEVGSVEAIKVLVANGIGASILPKLALPKAIARTAVRQLSPTLERTLGYVLRREKVIDRGLRVFVDELTKAAPR